MLLPTCANVLVRVCRRFSSHQQQFRQKREKEKVIERKECGMCERKYDHFAEEKKKTKSDDASEKADKKKSEGTRTLELVKEKNKQTKRI